MERKTMTKEELEKFAQEATSDEEQKRWENKGLGTDKAHAKRSDKFKPPSKLISIRVTEEVLEALKQIADDEGLKYQTYVASLLKKHVKSKKAVGQ